MGEGFLFLVFTCCSFPVGKWFFGLQSTFVALRMGLCSLSMARSGADRGCEVPIFISDDRVRSPQLSSAVRYNLSPDCNVVNWNPSERPLFVCGHAYDAWVLSNWIRHCVKELYGESSVVGEDCRFFTYMIVNMALKLRQMGAERGDASVMEVVQPLVDEGEALWASLGDFLWKSSVDRGTGVQRSSSEFLLMLFDDSGDRQTTRELTRRGLDWIELCQRYLVSKSYRS